MRLIINLATVLRHGILVKRVGRVISALFTILHRSHQQVAVLVERK